MLLLTRLGRAAKQQKKIKQTKEKDSLMPLKVSSMSQCHGPFDGHLYQGNMA